MPGKRDIDSLPPHQSPGPAAPFITMKLKALFFCFFHLGSLLCLLQDCCTPQASRVESCGISADRDCGDFLGQVDV